MDICIQFFVHIQIREVSSDVRAQKLKDKQSESS